MRPFLLIALLLFTLVPFVSSQPATSDVQLRGRVFDQNRAVVTGASVLVSNLAAKPQATTSSDSNGEFSISLPAGDYVLEIKAEGFNSTSRKLHVSPNERTEIEVSLEIASATATVTVSAGSEFQTGIVFSATKTPTAVRDLPQTISIVGKQQIAEQSFTSISDVVRYQAGVTSHQGENNRDQLIIRGQNSSADFFLNGVRDGVQYYRDLYNLESVEILRGPNALVFGRGGGGGVVNRVSKEAVDSPFYEFTAEGG